MIWLNYHMFWIYSSTTEAKHWRETSGILWNPYYFSGCSACSLNAFIFSIKAFFHACVLTYFHPVKFLTLKINTEWLLARSTFTNSKSTIETLERGVEICSKLTIIALERRQQRLSGVFNVNFEHNLHLFLVFLLSTLDK